MLEQELKAVIEKSLPEQVGALLKERLAKADRDAADLSQCRKDLNANENTRRDLSERVARVRSEYMSDSRNVPSQYGGTNMVTDSSTKTVTEERQ